MSLSAHDVAPAVISGNGVDASIAPMEYGERIDIIARLETDLAITKLERDHWKRIAEELRANPMMVVSSKDIGKLSPGHH